MVVHHWSDDGMVMHHRRSLVSSKLCEFITSDRSSLRYDAPNPLFSFENEIVAVTYWIHFVKSLFGPDNYTQLFLVYVNNFDQGSPQTFFCAFR